MTTSGIGWLNDASRRSRRRGGDREDAAERGEGSPRAAERHRDRSRGRPAGVRVLDDGRDGVVVEIVEVLVEFQRGRGVEQVVVRERLSTQEFGGDDVHP